MTLYEMLSDSELSEAIGRLSRLVEKLDRDPSPRALADGCHFASLLDEALGERDKRLAKQAATASTLQGEG